MVSGTFMDSSTSRNNCLLARPADLAAHLAAGFAELFGRTDLAADLLGPANFAAGIATGLAELLGRTDLAANLHGTVSTRPVSGACGPAVSLKTQA